MPTTRRLESLLTAYWKLDSTYGTTVGRDALNSHHLNLGYVNSGAGKINEAAAFTRTSSNYLATPSTSSLQSLKTLALWVKFTSLNNDMSLAHKGTAATAANSSLWLKYTTSTGALTFSVGDGAGGSSAATTSGITFTTGTWYFVCCRYNTATGKLSLAVNGVVYGTAVCSLTQYVETGVFYLGRDSSGSYFDGLLDEAAVSQSCLTIAEEFTLYNGGTGIQPPFLEGPIGASSSSGRYPRRLPPSFAQADNGNVYVAYGDECVRKWDGLNAGFPCAGVPSPVATPAVTSGGEGRIVGDRFAYVRYLDADGRVSNLSPISPKHAAFGSYKAITGATNASPIVITAAAHGLATGEVASVMGVQGNTAANGMWYVEVINANTFSLMDSAGNGEYLSVNSGRVNATTLRDGAPAVNEVQSITSATTPTSGTWTISFNGSETSALTYNATPSTVRSALEMLPSVGAGNVTVTGGPLGATPFIVTFIGALAGADQPLMTVGISSLLGASSSITITTTTQGAAGPSEVQTISFSAVPSGGTWTVTHNGATTSALASTINAATLQTALEGLGTIGSGNIAVTGGGPGTADFVCSFQGALASTTQPQMTTSNSLLGANVTVGVVVLTEGNPGTNEVQQFQLYGTPTGGTFTLTYDGQTTVAIAYNASNATIDTELEALSNIGVGDVAISGGPLPGSAVVVTFGGALATTNVSQLIINGALLTGGSISASVSTITPGLPSLTTNLSNYWKLDEVSGTRYDSIGTRDLSEGVTAIASTSGKIINAAAFNARTTYQSPWLTGNANAIGSAYTLACWARFGGASGGGADVQAGIATVIGSSSGTLREFILGFNLTTGLVSLRHKVWTASGFGTEAVTTSGFLPAGWNFFVMVLAGPNASKLYLNGDLVGTAGSFPAAPESLLSVALGKRLGGTDSPFLNMHVDECGLWTEALSAEKITRLYNSGAGLTTPFAAAQNEVQRVTLSGSPAQGTFTLAYSGQTSTDIAYNASAATIDTELEVLSNIGSGQVTCTGGPLPGTAVDVEFTGTLAATDVSQMTTVDSGLKTSISTTTQGSGVQSEVQRLTATPTPTTGTFTLTFGANTTAAIAYTASAATIQSALEGLASIGAGNVSCSGGPINASSVTVAFQNALANTNVALISVASSMNGNPPTITVNTTTEGGPGPNEVQRISASPVPVTGTFTLTFGANTTAALAYNATAATVQTALQGLASIGSGNIAVTGGPLSAGNALVGTFQGTLAQTNVAAMTAVSSMTGQAGPVTVSVTTTGAVAKNERQQFTTAGVITGGTFTLTYSGQTTSPLDYTVTASTTQAALTGLSNIGTGNLVASGGSLNQVPVEVEFQGVLAATNLSEITVNNGGIVAGGFARGAQFLTYANVEAPTDRRVTRRQVLRNKAGDASVFYIDIDTTDLMATTFTSNKTDEELTDAVALQDDNGADLNVTRHGEPPNTKRVIASFLNRLFLAVNHRSTSGELTLTNGSATLSGEDAFIRTAYDARTVYPQGTANTRAYDIESLSVASQTVTAVAPYAGITGAGVTYGLEAASPEDLTLYFSEIDDPEWWNVLNGLSIARDDQDGELTGLSPLITSLLILFEHRIYKLSFRTSPLLSSNPDFGGDGRIIPASWRGCVNSRCCVKHAGKAYMLDTKGCYSYDDNSVEELSDPIAPIFAAGSPLSIYWHAKDSFHAVSDIENDTVKWFVVIGDGQYPRHALCYHTERKRWWIEEYPFPVTSSCTGRYKGRLVVLYGSTARRLFVATENLDAISVQTNNQATLRGTPTSALAYTLTDTAASFPSSLVSVPVVIVSGKGAGQQNIIVANTSTKLTLLNPWTITPDTTSVYQIGGIKWKWKSSMMRLDQKGSESMRGVQTTFSPTTRASTVVLRTYPDFNGTADTFSVDYQSDGVKTTSGSDQIVLDLTLSQGFVEVCSDSFFTGRGRHQRYVTVEATGVTNGERQKINQVDVVGAES